MATNPSEATVEWFGMQSEHLRIHKPPADLCWCWFLGSTTFRVKAKGVTIFLDTWLERPSIMQQFAKIDDMDECDYIIISHAHFGQYVRLRLRRLSPGYDS